MKGLSMRLASSQLPSRRKAVVGTADAINVTEHAWYA
jgi:hypothetical protein